MAESTVASPKHGTVGRVSSVEMRSIIEDAVIIYKQELESLQILVIPAILLGPILAMVAATNLTLALVTTPAFLLVYGVCYAASVRGAGMLLNNRDPSPGAVYSGVLAKSIDVWLAGAPLALLAAGLAVAGLVASDLGDAFLAPIFAIAGGACVLVWASRHALDLPLILVYGLGAHDATHVGNVIARRSEPQRLALLTMVAAPVALAALLGWGAGAWLAPVVGAGIFLIALALWLPFAAVAMTVHTSQLVETADLRP